MSECHSAGFTFVIGLQTNQTDGKHELKKPTYSSVPTVQPPEAYYTKPLESVFDMSLTGLQIDKYRRTPGCNLSGVDKAVALLTASPRGDDLLPGHLGRPGTTWDDLGTTWNDRGRPMGNLGRHWPTGTTSNERGPGRPLF